MVLLLGWENLKLSIQLLHTNESCVWVTTVIPSLPSLKHFFSVVDKLLQLIFKLIKIFLPNVASSYTFSEGLFHLRGELNAITVSHEHSSSESCKIKTVSNHLSSFCWLSDRLFLQGGSFDVSRSKHSPSTSQQVEAIGAWGITCTDDTEVVIWVKSMDRS